MFSSYLCGKTKRKAFKTVKNLNFKLLLEDLLIVREFRYVTFKIKTKQKIIKNSSNFEKM